MTPKRSPTLKDVGKQAGVTAATASMALRRDPRIPIATQKRVLRAAEELGYRPDPILAALVSRRRNASARKTFASLAVLIDEGWLPMGETPVWMQSFLSGMHRMAKQLGYHMEALFYPRDLVLGGNADRILHARGIRGIALFPLPGEQKNLVLDWDHYSLVVIGHPSLPRRPHRVGSDPFAAMNLACQKLREYGYKRVGLAHAFHQETELRYEFLGALCKENYLHGKAFQMVPPHLPVELTRTSFLAWFHKHRPECVITVEESILNWLCEAGHRVPDDLGVAFLNTHIIKHPDASGTLLHNDATGENAVELLHTQLLRGETGFPDNPKEVLAYPRWVDGGTIKPLKGRNRNGLPIPPAKSGKRVTGKG